MSAVVVFLLIAAALGVLIWTTKERNRPPAPPAGLFDIGGRSRSRPEPLRATPRPPRAQPHRSRQTAVRGRVKNPDAPCWVCSQSLADGHTH
jgi:hypothetical protein